MKSIVIITDCSDVAIEQMKARISTMLSDFGIAHKIYCVFARPFQVTNGMFLCSLISEEIHSDSDTLYLAVLNPLKDKPKRIFGRLNNGAYFVGADTGLFSLIFKKYGISELWETNNPGHYPFGGLHVHSVVAAKLLIGEEPSVLGTKVKSIDVKTYFPEQGEVVHIDNFGLIKIWSRPDELGIVEGELIMLKIYSSQKVLKKEVLGMYSNRMMNYDDDELLVYPGSSLLDHILKKNCEEYRKSGLIEIGLVRNSRSADQLEICLGDIIKVSKR